MSASKEVETKIGQSDKFKQAARELGCDDDEARFDDRLRKIAKHKPVEVHWSDCAVNNGPAIEPGPCDCGGFTPGNE